MSYHVYLIITTSSKIKKSYVGYTKNLKKRLILHNSGKGAKATKGFKWKLLFKKKFITKIEAMKFEYFLKKNRFLNIIQTSKHILSQSEVHDFAECGCWKGHSTYLIAKNIADSKKNITFHIFDSFEGLSESTSNDGNFHNLNNLSNQD